MEPRTEHGGACNPRVMGDVRTLLAAMHRQQDLRDPSERSAKLRSAADALEAQRDAILAVAARETALTRDELSPEFQRTVGTLRMFARLVEDGSWVRAVIDTRSPDAIGPGHDVRSMLTCLDGPVAVFGASNFPLAYGVCGGDTASALAAGCPVVVKEHPAHPETGRLLARIVESAIGPGFVGYIENTDPADTSAAEFLVGPRTRLVRAVGFTGSLRGGAAIGKLASEPPRPIPVFAEMGSVNPVVVTRKAAERRGQQIADEIADSLLVRFGQQCTCPGMVLVPPSDEGDALVERLVSRVNAAAGRDMLAPWIRDSYLRRLEEVAACRGVREIARGATAPGPRGAHAALFCVDSVFQDGEPTFYVFDQAAARDEIFGPAAIVVRHFPEEMSDLNIGGSLTASIYLEPDDDPFDDTSEFAGGRSSWAARMAGRVVFNGPPTGVRVAAGMVHGGPWPATNRPDTTAVGPLAIERWCRPVCFQNCPDELLPPELRDANPLGILRMVDGVMTRDAVARR